MRKNVLSAKLTSLTKPVKAFALGAIALGAFNKVDAQSWSNVINQNNGVIMAADYDNSHPNEDFVWILDGNIWGEGSNIEKMRLSAAKLRLNTAFSMKEGQEFIIDSQGVAGGRFIVTPAGNVGIGTAYPGYKFHLNGNMRVEKAISIAGGSAFSVDGNHITSGRFLIQPDGNIGIGMTAPTEKLHVGGSTKVEGGLTVNGAIKTNNNLEVVGATKATNGLEVSGYTRLESPFSMAGEPEFSIDAPNIEGGRLVVKQNGNVGIGTANPTKGKLEVVGSFHVTNTAGHQTFHVSAGQQLVFVGDSAYIKYQAAQSNPGSHIHSGQFSLWVSKGVVTEDLAFADVDEWDDYVFNTDYKLPALDQVAAFIKANKHLPGIPSESEVKQVGYSVHKLNRGLLKNLEELTLHAIGQEKKIKDLESEIAAQKMAIARYETLAAEVAQLKAILSSPSK